MNRFFLLACFFASSVLAKAETSLFTVFSNNMVLQTTTDVRLYGWANPNEEFRIYAGWNNVIVNTNACNDAKLKAYVSTSDIVGLYEVKIFGSGNQIVFDTIVIGEVWPYSGLGSMKRSDNKVVKNPKAVHYIWKSTAMGNLFNEAGLSASTFTSE